MDTSRVTRRPTRRLLAAALVVAGALLAAAQPAPRALPQVHVDYFYEPGCAECDHIERETIPELAQRYADSYVLNRYDVGIASNYLRLVTYQENAGVKDNAHVYMVLDGLVVLTGLSAIRTNLWPSLDICLAARLETVAPVPPAPARDPATLLTQRFRAFTLLGVAGAGLVDSINPCAFSTLVFFMSLLSMARVGRRGMLLAGVAFIAACFATYLLLGFGLFRLLHLFAGFGALRRTVDVVMVAALAALAWLSFRDAVRYRRTGRPDDVALQLPAGIQRRIHDVMRRGLRRRRLLLGGFGIGAAVTLLESVCTGQVYVPTLVMVVRTGQSVARGLGYLLVYNLMFILPLAIILALTYRGLGTPALVAWSRKNVVISKALLGLLFLGMAALIVAL